MEKINYRNDWQISSDQFDESNLAKFESIMALGNGYLTIRNSHEEVYPLEKRNFFVAGMFNKFSEDEVTELAAFPDISKIVLWINGHRFSLLQGKTEEFVHLFDYRTGESKRSFIWSLDENICLRFCFSKFVSMDNKHLTATHLELENLGETVDVVIESGIDGSVTNTGSQHFEEGEKRYFDKKNLYVKTQTTESDVVVAVACRHHLSVAHTTRARMARRQIYERKQFQLGQGETATFTKCSLVKTDRDLAYEKETYLKESLLTELDRLSSQTYEELFEKNQQAWEKIWTEGKVQIKGAIRDALLLNFSRYHLHAMSPIHDPRMNIGAKGMTGEGYKGHTFWDTEIFILPYFIYMYPEWAKNLILYRVNGLEAAKKNAQKNGYDGAQYPWESAWLSDGETTPEFGDIDIVTGQATPILTGKIEHHVTGDVIQGALEYLKATQDEALEEQLFEVIMETAKFWCSRVTWQEAKQRYEILDVIGPDEYKEHVDNNAYTNYLAKYNLDHALKTFEEHVGTEKNKAYQQDIEKIRAVAEKLYLPVANEQGIVPQDDTYLQKEILDLTSYLADEEVNTIFLDYNLEQVNEMQVTKQADILLLLSLFIEQFSEELLLKNWDYYYPKTLHDSSLSLTTHCTFALQLDKIDLAYDLFQRSFDIDLGANNMKSSDMGIHSASMGGVWQNVVRGFGGFSLEEGQIRIQPRLPDAWEELIYTVNVSGAKLEITVTADTILVKNLKGSVPSLVINGKIYSIDKNQLLVKR